MRRRVWSGRDGRPLVRVWQSDRSGLRAAWRLQAIRQAERQEERLLQRALWRVRRGGLSTAAARVMIGCDRVTTRAGMRVPVAGRANLQKGSDMRVLACSIACLFAFSVAAAPPKPTVDTNPSTVVVYSAIGVTQAETDGSASAEGAGGVGTIGGYGALDKMCADEFGPGARAATTEEADHRRFQITGNQPWVVPTGTIRAVETASGWQAIDAANHSVGFTSAGEIGTITSAACFKFRSKSSSLGGPRASGVSNCEDPGPVLCSAPFAVPVSP
jgi:hypothetical protein